MRSKFQSVRPPKSIRPAQSVRPSQSMRPPTQGMRTSAVVPVANLCVLVIDDDDMVRRALVRGLRRRYAVTEVRDAESALALIASGRRFDAILCDLNLTGMSGRDFFLNLDATDEHQAKRVIILSGNLGGVQDELFGETAPRFLEKPASMAKIDAIVSEVACTAAHAA